MMEIERKFLVKNDNYKKIASSTRFTQGYLNSDQQRTVRIRIEDDNHGKRIGYITIKGIGNETGASRYEWEKEIPYEDTYDLMKLCKPGVIDKIRHKVKIGTHTFEVDEFLGDNQGLIIAEIELKDEKETFEIPKWLGKEVTGVDKYYNSQLSKLPFKDWK